MARPRKPPEELERLGAYAKDPQRRITDAAKPLAGCPVKPVEVADDPAADKAWDEVAEILSGMGTLSPSYQKQMTQYAKACARADQCWRIVNEEGLIVTNEKGVPSVHPAQKEWDALTDKILKICIEFGLTPAARSRVRTGKSEEDSDPVLDMLKRMQTKKVVAGNG
jgi:P27 family predicted phage terminase small subunit